jgi:hypothetical protein
MQAKIQVVGASCSLFNPKRARCLHCIIAKKELAFLSGYALFIELGEILLA